jgi:ATP-dependent DNA ligase
VKGWRFIRETSKQHLRAWSAFGAWRKMRINQGQEFVIGGYTPSGRNFDALIFGYYEGKKLIYVARTRNGFTPQLRDQLFKRFRGLQIPECPFSNVPKRNWKPAPGPALLLRF